MQSMLVMFADARVIRMMKGSKFPDSFFTHSLSLSLIFFLASGGRKVFREFLKCEYSEENILFWLACEDLKNEVDSELIEEKCRVIYEDYISILSPKEVSLYCFLQVK